MTATGWQTKLKKCASAPKIPYAPQCIPVPKTSTPCRLIAEHRLSSVSRSTHFKNVTQISLQSPKSVYIIWKSCKVIRPTYTAFVTDGLIGASICLMEIIWIMIKRTLKFRRTTSAAVSGSALPLLHSEANSISFQLKFSRSCQV